jgi:hypothetical protein
VILNLTLEQSWTDFLCQNWSLHVLPPRMVWQCAACVMLALRLQQGLQHTRAIVAERARMLTGKVLCDAVSFLGQDECRTRWLMICPSITHITVHLQGYCILTASSTPGPASMHCCAALPCDSARRLNLKASRMSAAVLRVPACGL